MNKLLTNLCALLLVGLLPLLAHAQPRPIGNANGTLLCAGKVYTFSSTTDPSTAGCLVNYTVTGGTVQAPAPTTAGNFQVVFDDVPAGSATLRAVYSGCSSTAASGQSPVLTVYIRSITNQQLGALTLDGSTSGNILFGSTDPVTLEVPLLAIPRNAAEPNPATIYAETYEWTIPSGWRWPDGTASTGAPRLRLS